MYAAAGHAIYRIRISNDAITHIAGAFNESGNADGVGAAARFNDLTYIWGDGATLDVSGTHTGIRRIDLSTER
jgi:hypothetical protein